MLSLSSMHWKVSHTPHFTAQYKLLPRHVQELAKGVFESVMEDPYHPNLRTHKLNKRLASYFSLSIDPKYRIICRIFEGQQEIVLHDVGTHDIYESFGG